MTLISAFNEWSCVPACLESIANDSGIEITQEEMINKFKGNFPEWQKMPGAITENRLKFGAETFRLAKLIDIADKYKILADAKAVISELKDDNTVGIIMITEKYLHPNGQSTDLIHARRILCAHKSVFLCMNPIRGGEGIYELHAWGSLDALQAQTICLKKDSPNNA